MKQLKQTAKTATFYFDIPVCSANKVPNVNHQVSLDFSAGVSAGSTAVVGVTPLGCSKSETLTDGSLDAYALTGSQKTITLQGLLVSRITVTLSGFSSGSVTGYYTGYGVNDPGVDDQYS